MFIYVENKARRLRNMPSATMDMDEVAQQTAAAAADDDDNDDNAATNDNATGMFYCYF